MNRIDFRFSIEYLNLTVTLTRLNQAIVSARLNGLNQVVVSARFVNGTRC